MAATKQTKAPNRHPTIQSNPSLPQHAHHITNPDSAVNGKKKKKKKSKAKSSDTNAQGTQTDDDLPSLDPSNLHPTNIPSPRRTGLSPELESVHLSTTASLSASAAAAARLNATAAAQAELLATANDLYRRMDSDAMPDDEDYWAALPTHIKNFVKMTYSTSTNPNINPSERSKAQSMLAIAHQMIQSGVEKTSPKGNQPPGAYPSLPFDPAIFSDPAFGLAMEQTLAANNPLPPAPGQPPRGPLPHPSVVLLNEYNGDDNQDYDYSEDEVDDNVEDHEHDTGFVGYEYRMTNNGNNNNGNNEMGKKKSKKKKKKGAAANTAPVAPPTQLQQPPTSRPAPPTTTPLPSSRAAGKQPMSYTNAAPPATTATQNIPSRTARTTTNATTKPPVSGHYHHSSPTSSQTSHSKTNNNPAPSSAHSKLWSTNSNEERERIKEFWLSLGEEERRALVKVEKEAVLKKMKEQQKHSCSCAVCGRKRHAIEEELEVLYDAYYDELEQYANHQQQYASSGGKIPPPPGPGPFPGSVELDKNGAVVGSPHHHRNAAGRTAAHNPHSHPTNNVQRKAVNGVSVGVNARKGPESSFEDEDGEDEYEEDEDYEDDDEEEEDEEDEGDEVEDEEPEKKPPTRRSTGPPGRDSNGQQTTTQDAVNGVKPNVRDDLFNFGNNLAVTGESLHSAAPLLLSGLLHTLGSGNILTVADDLLKNDGRKFLEMMEQLAERRMQREEEAAAEVGMDSEDDEDDEDGDEDDVDNEDDEDDEEDEEEAMTEEQKMEEGRRMFSIFAARMFEQRVLQAYREKVAQERQMQILRELEDEDKAAQEREAKKQKENQKKKAKKMLQKQAKEEEKKQKEAEKAVEEAALKAKLLAQEEEQKKKREEERLRREAARKAQEDERARKEEERRKRLAEEKERQAEQERKRKEREERLKAERKEREEKERKAREEKEARVAAEKAAAAAKREQLEKEEREKRAQKEAEERKEREAKERLLREQQQQHAIAASTSSNKVRVPTSPRSSTLPGGTSSRNSISSVAPKKILSKPPTTPVTSSGSSSNVMPSQPVASPVPTPSTPSAPTLFRLPAPPQRPAVVTQLQNTAAPQPQHPVPIPSTSQIQSPGPSTTPISISGFHGFPSPGGAMSLPGHSGSPFTNGPVPPFIPYGGPPGIPPPPLVSSNMPRGYGNSGFDSFRPLVTPSLPPSLPSAIGPLPKGLPNPPGSPIGMFSPGPPGSSTGHLRRGSVQERSGSNSFGVVQRPIAPIAPIARPQNSKDDEKIGSPKMKSSSSTPAPEPVLGSSALVADDDEPIMVPPRRVVAPVGWGTPQLDPISSRPGWTANQNLSFATPGRAPNGMWGPNPGPDPWQHGPFPLHPQFPPAFANSPPPGT
ncbi:hypothetical protein Clacol_003478 [Clathrus columnatus]|uniref:Stress response protein NST1 n=1 Tax=Clathrus columnatus TaxID=1419009 RepID=A0AAV5A3M3_9AGAM|nr:hypothetical protein Clacol_003478 [Clathrus columnatus]